MGGLTPPPPGSGDPYFRLDLSLGVNYPAITWDVGDDLYFDRVSNNWTWRIGGASVFVVESTATRPGADNTKSLGSSAYRWSDTWSVQYHAGDANYWIGFSGVVPLVNFDVGDYTYYDRSGNVYVWVVGAATQMVLSTATLYPDPDNAKSLGTASNRWSNAYASQLTLDANFYLNFSGANPQTSFDAGDFQYYDRTNNLFVTAIGNAAKFVIESGDVRPGGDNATSLGTASFRWSTVYAGTGTINTSDQREKTALRPFADAELDAWGEVSAGVYQYLDAVARKGADHAREHYGYTAQTVEAAFRANGLDPARCALWCSDPKTHPVSKTRKVVRQATVMETVTETVVEVGSDGVPVQREVTREVERPATRDVPVVNAVGEPVMVDRARLDMNGRPLIDEAGRPIVDRIPLTHPVPVTEEVEETYEAEEPVLGPDGTPDVRFGLRYDQCAVIEAAWQRRRADRLEARLAALEVRAAA